MSEHASHEKYTPIEHKIDPLVAEGIQEVAQDLVDNYGTISPDGNFRTGTFLIRSEAIPGQPEKVPTLKINIPVEPEGYGWKTEVNLSMQDAALSQHVLLTNDLSMRVSSYDSRPEVFMTAADSGHFLESLQELSRQIKSDLD